MSNEWQPPQSTDEQERRLREANPETLAEILGGEEVAAGGELELHDLPEGQGLRFGRHQLLSPLRSLVRRAQEATEPVDEDDVQEPGLLDPLALKLITRRDTLQKGGIAAVGLGLLLAGIGIGRGSENRDPVDAMRSDLERKFNVRFTTESGATWTLENLTVMAQILDVLPSAWFHPSSGEVMEIAEVLGVIDEKKIADDALPEYKISLLASKNHDDDEASYAFEDLNSEQFVSDIAQVCIPRIPIHEQTGMSAWFHAIDQELKMPFQQFALQRFVPSIREKYVSLLERMENRSPLGRVDTWRVDFAIELLSSFLQDVPPNTNPRAKDYPNTFMPMLALHYMRGEGYFLDMYTEAFGKEMATRLYNFAKSAMFKGKTYDRFPLVSETGRYNPNADHPFGGPLPIAEMYGLQHY